MSENDSFYSHDSLGQIQKDNIFFFFYAKRILSDFWGYKNTSSCSSVVDIGYYLH